MEEKNLLPPLIKQSATYKLYVPRKVEEKIRYLIHKFPHTEWSGILFIKHTGSFENNDLEIHCEDIYPMDLGTGGWTEFKMTEDVTAYIANNIELFECDLALVHSHHSMGAFFSGQDIKTLQIEGNDTNCFVSLIVDTRGTYQAAVTRKVKSKTEVVTKSLGSSYQFFGNGEIKTDEDPMSESTRVIDKEVIEYFMLDVSKETIDNPFDFLDKRFEEIESKKKNVSLPKEPDTFEYKFLNPERYKSASAKENLLIEEPSMFSREEMGEVITSNWEPDSKIIHHLVCQMITCSLIINKDIDLKQWIVRHMNNKYKEIFEESGDPQHFNEWKEFIVEFLFNQYEDSNLPGDAYDDYDLYLSKIASAMYDSLCEYPTNGYIEQYKEILMRYIYE